MSPHQTAAAVPLGTFHAASANDVPPEVLALGEADSLHPPSLESIVGFDEPWLVTTVGVGTSLVAGVLAAMTAGTVYMPVACFGVFLGCLLAAGPQLLKWGNNPTYLLYRDALVLMRGDDFTVLPWDRIVELNSPRAVVTDDGKGYELSLVAKKLGHLYDVVRHEVVTKRLLPTALATLEAGEAVTFGPLTISSNEISYKGTTVGWHQVSSLTIIGPAHRSLRIGIQGHLLPWSVALNQVPNDALLVDLVREVCPKHLLVRTGQG